jgi:hypothetical protein
MLQAKAAQSTCPFLRKSLVHPEFGKFVRYAIDEGVNAGLSINPLMLTKKSGHRATRS